MSPSLIQEPAARNTRARFAARVSGLLTNVRLLWLPLASETTTSTDLSVAARTITYNASVAGSISARGNGSAIAFNGTSQFGTTPDAVGLSFGDGSVDVPFTVVVVANVTDTAATRALISKWGAGTTNGEWDLSISSSDTLQLRTRDASATVNTRRESNAAITQGSWVVLGATYNSTGGASNHDNTVLYVNGAAVASTATNNASYVATENLANACEIGAHASADYFSGSLAMAALGAKALTAAEHQSMFYHCRAWFAL